MMKPGSLINTKGIIDGSLIMTAWLCLPGISLATEDNFSQGVKLFKAEQFDAAATKFETALESGNNSATLYYNLAVSYYKIKKYPQAQQHFLTASKDKNLSAISYYNLGLVAEKQNDSEKAADWFERSYAQAKNPALKTLAARKLGISDKAPQEKNHNWSGFVSAAFGHDNNVNHVNDDLPLTSNQSDNYLDLFAIASYQLSGNTDNGTAIKLAALITDYNNLNNYDFSSLNGGIYQYQKLNKWHTRYGAHIYRDSINGSSYQQRINLQYRADNNYADGQKFRAQYDLSLINDLDSNYSHLAGNRQRFKVQNTTRLKDKQIKLGYVLELNDRDDLKQGSSFNSYSATRHTFAASLKQPINEKWTGRADLSYRLSDYNDARVIANISQGTRKDNRTRLRLRGIYHYSKTLEFEGMIRRTNNSSNFSTSDYSNTIVQISANLDF